MNMDQISTVCPNQSATGSGQLFTSLIQILVAAQCNISRPDMWPEDATYKLLEEYDFIVVGAGSAGCVVASRLSEIEDWNVLIIEAGGDPPIISEIPGLMSTMSKSEFDWNYYTEPGIKHSLAFENRTSFWSRGKLLGGCSAHNGFVYLRGNRKDYDNWERLGNYGWGYNDVLNYFKKSEDLKIPSLVYNDGGKYHGVGGELKVDNFVYSIKIDYYLDAVKELGYDFIEDLNGEQNIGFGVYPANVDGVARCSAAKAFLTKRKRNLHVLKNAFVTKVIINPRTKQATGVEFAHNLLGLKRVKANKEVIVSAGSVNTPQLLMLSGVGPSKELNKHGIPTMSNLAVGKNVQDHFLLPTIVGVNHPNSSDLSSDKTDILDNLYMYLRHQSGPLTSTGGWNVCGFISTNYEWSKYPNLQIFNTLFRKQNADSVRGFFGRYGYPDDYTESIVRSNEISDTLIIRFFMINPKSRGEITLRSANPFDKPIINANYLDEDEDVETLVGGATFLNRFIRTKAMRRQGAHLIEGLVRNCLQFIFNSDNYWRCAARNIGMSGYHTAGSCKMGPADDPTAVVSPKLMVYGVKGLRVADASIMPFITSANTNAPTIMIGEKAADMIKADWLRW